MSSVLETTLRAQWVALEPILEILKALQWLVHGEAIRLDLQVGQAKVNLIHQVLVENQIKELILRVRLVVQGLIPEIRRDLQEIR